MQRVKTILAFLAFTVTSVLLLPSIASPQQRHKLEGEVLDNGNTPIVGVLVRIYRGSEKVGEDRTKQDGRYLISFVRGSPISTIRYDQTDWNPATINDVSGARDHNINKVLHRVGSKLSYDEAMELLSVLERLYYIDRANNIPVASLREQYGSVIDKMHIPESLQQKLKEIRRLYEESR
jgi:hypothetical protein